VEKLGLSESGEKGGGVVGVGGWEWMDCEKLFLFYVFIIFLF